MGICCLLLKNLASDCETWSCCKIDLLAKFHMTSCSSWEIVMKHHTSTPSHVLQGSVTVHPSINSSIYCLYEIRLRGHQSTQDTKILRLLLWLMGPQEDGPMEFLWACFSYPGPHPRMGPLWLKSHHCKKVTIHFCTSSLNKPVLYGVTQWYPKACCMWINSLNLSSWLYCLLLFSVTFLLILFTLVIFKETPSLCSLDPLYSLLWLLLNQFRKWDA